MLILAACSKNRSCSTELLLAIIKLAKWEFRIPICRSVTLSSAYQTMSDPKHAPGASVDTGIANTVITILHFNDVYNIEPRVQEPVGGAARFTTAVRQMAHLEPLVLFSGDAFNPSIMSTVTKGKHMIPILNNLGVQCAVYGNHDFDFGVDTLTKHARECKFPWLMSNVIDMTTDKPLADGLVSHMITWKGVKIGIIGLVEEEWIDTLATIDPEEVMCIDFVEEGHTLARELKEQGADYIIALTHMRWPNDIRLAENVPEIDLILGGHDHDFTIKQVNGRYVLKSGTDFRQMAQLTLTFRPDGSVVSVDVKEVVIDSTYAEDPEAKEIVTEFMKLMGEKMETVIGELEVELDGRFASIRTSETNLGNFITDIMLEATAADMALLNSGTLRSDALHPKGEFKIKDLMAILPMIDPLVVIGITGRQVIAALENSVSKYPVLEGRFPQVSGMTFGFDPTMPAGKRIDYRHVRIQGNFLDQDKNYSLVTKSYLSEGKDGYDVFKKCTLLVSDENSPALTTAVQNHFKSVQILRGQKKAKSAHRQSIIPLNRRKSLLRQMTIEDNMMSSSFCNDVSQTGTPPDHHVTSHSGTPIDHNATHSGSPPGSRTPAFDRSCRMSVDEHLSVGGAGHTPFSRASIASPSRSHMLMMRRTSIQTVEMDCASSALAPSIEGRIFIVNDRNRASLDESWTMSNIQHSTIIEEVNESPLNSPVAVNNPTASS